MFKECIQTCGFHKNPRRLIECYPNRFMLLYTYAQHGEAHYHVVLVGSRNNDNLIHEWF